MYTLANGCRSAAALAVLLPLLCLELFLQLACRVVLASGSVRTCLSCWGSVMGSVGACFAWLLGGWHPMPAMLCVHV
jgi:hypothetical protein